MLLWAGEQPGPRGSRPWAGGRAGPGGFGARALRQVRGAPCSPQLVSPFSWQEEKLEGDNRYFCESCQSKQNATRRIRLLSLPCTLNLQLMRFVFDRWAASALTQRPALQG